MNEQLSKNFGFGQIKRETGILNNLQLKTKSAFVLVIIVLVLGIGSLIINKVFELKKINSLNRQIDLNKQRSFLLENSILNFPKQKDKAQELLNSHIYFSKIFDFFRENTLKTVFYDKISIDAEARSLNLEAVALSFEEAAKQLVLIKSIKDIDSFDVDSVSLNSNGKINFFIKIKLKDNFFNNI
ncbi:MAG: hypothetical protein AAB593_01830 [Patescibacteria group bacterium]